MSVRILHLADLHLGASFPVMGERGVERGRDLLNAYLRAVEFAAGDARPVDFVIIAGDLFDTHDPDSALVYQVEASFEKLHRAGVPVFLVPGTHDAHIYRRLRLPEGSQLFVQPVLTPGPRLVIRGETVQVYGIAYDPAVSQRPLGEFRPVGEADYHVGILHAALQDSPTWKLRASDLPLTRTEIAASGLHYMALGHYHNFAEVRESGTVAIYPGTLEGRKFGENGPRYLVTATLSRDAVSIERTPWNARTLTEVNLDLLASDVQDEEQLTERITAFAGDREILRFRLTGAAHFVFDAEQLAQRMAPRFFHVELDDQTYLVNQSLLERFKDEATVRGIFVRRMLERIEHAASARDRETAMLALRIGLAEFQNPRHAA
jgi:exonuclease SbcD